MAGQPDAAGPPAQEPAVDGDGSFAPIIPLVAGALVALITALTVRHLTHRESRRTHIAA